MAVQKVWHTMIHKSNSCLIGLMRSPNSPPAAARNKRKRVFARTPRGPAKGCRPLHSCFLRERISPNSTSATQQPQRRRCSIRLKEEQGEFFREDPVGKSPGV